MSDFNRILCIHLLRCVEIWHFCAMLSRRLLFVQTHCIERGGEREQKNLRLQISIMCLYTWLGQRRYVVSQKLNAFNVYDFHFLLSQHLHTWQGICNRRRLAKASAFHGQHYQSLALADCASVRWLKTGEAHSNQQCRSTSSVDWFNTRRTSSPIHLFRFSRNGFWFRRAAKPSA